MNYSKLLLPFVIVLVLSCNQNHNLSAEIVGLDNDTIYVESYRVLNIEENPILDTIYSENGKFFYNLPVNEPVISIITPKKAEYIRLDKSSYRPTEKSILIVVKPGDEISIRGNLEKSAIIYQAKGSQINQAYSNLRDGYLNLQIEKSKIELQIDSLIFNNGDRDRVNTLFEKRTEKSKLIAKIQLDYVKKNLDEDISAFFLTRQPLDTLGKYYEKLNRSIKEGIFKNPLEVQLSRFLKYVKVRDGESRIKKGEKAPIFSLPSINQENFAVNFSNNKYTVLDFWGSWCRPCIKGFPKMSKYYEKYKNQIEFIGIACLDTEEEWISAIEKNELQWINLFNDDEIEQDVSVMYAVKEFPTKILINPNGIIEEVFKGEGDDFYSRLDKLMIN